MSNIYALEPHTNAKVILHSSMGDIEIELWGKEAPRATRNFIQLCLEGYYDNTIFHRIVPGFLVQGGDPTGTGQGGESIYEDGFPDEFHSRLRFNRRGLVGVANTGSDDNGSQFFITLDRADELTKKHTLFGRVAGDTLFNVMKMTELELDENERPLYPPRIKSAEVILNPFDDIIPRITAEEKKKAKLMEQKKREELEKKKKKPQKKQLNLLSFGEEASELEASELEPSEEEAKRTKMKSTYDFMENAVSTPPDLIQELKKEMKEEKGKISMNLEEKVLEKVKKHSENRKQQEKEKIDVPLQTEKEEKTETEKITSTIEKLKQDIRNISKVTTSEEVPIPKKEKKKSLVALEREKYASQQKRNKRKADKYDDNDVFNKLMEFQKKLASVKTSESTTEEIKEKEKMICKLHDIPNCESCFDPETLKEEDVNDEGWISHKLIFDKDLKGKDLMRRKETVDDYVVIDPREREAKAKQEEYEKRRSIKSHTGSSSNKRVRDERDYDDRYNRRKYNDNRQHSSRHDDSRRK